MSGFADRRNRLRSATALTVVSAASALAVGATLPAVAGATARPSAAGVRARSAPSGSDSTATSVGTDWEARGAGVASASFSAVNTRARGKHSEQLENIVVQAPITCADSPTPAIPVDTEVIAATVPVAANGSFSTGSIKAGGSGTAFSGRILGRKVTISYRHVARSSNQFDGGTEVCDTGKVHLSGAPGHRITLADQSWAGQTKDGEPVVVNVVAGGRALQEPSHPPANGAAQASIAFGTFTLSCAIGSCTQISNDVCGYAETTTLFIAANGSFGNATYQEEDQPTYTGRFTSARALGGTFTNGGEGCEEEPWSATPG
jgi:hypothetical protein